MKKNLLLIALFPPAGIYARARHDCFSQRAAGCRRSRLRSRRTSAGWQWTTADAEGTSKVEGALPYGPFYDARKRTFVYHIIPSATGSGEFSGEATGRTIRR